MKKIWLLVILAFVLRIISILILKQYLKPDVWEYDAIASNLLAGKGYVYPYMSNNCLFFGYPFYAYFSAAIHLITNKNYFILEIIQALIAALSVIPLFYIAKAIFNHGTAMITGLAYSFHLGLIVYTGKIHELTLVVLFILTLSCLIIYFKEKVWFLIATGVLTGLGMLLRPTFIFFIPAYFIYLIVKKYGLKKAILNSFIVTLLAALIISPWIYRGYRKYNRFIFITTTSGINFWMGNNSNASGSALTKDNRPIFSTAGEVFKNKASSLDEIEQDHFFRDEAIKYIKANPLIFFKMTAKKFVYFWSFSPQAGLEYPKSWLVIYKILYYVLAVFFISGIFFIFRSRFYINMPAIVFLFSFLLMNAMAHSLYYIDMRYRWMVEPLLIIFSSYGIINFAQLLHNVGQGDKNVY